MKKPQVYIDGQSGTTGLQIFDRLAGRGDIELLEIDYEKRHEPAERAKLMNAADVVFFCLPDAEAAEAAKLVENPGTCVIDASTAHRTAPGWQYGIPELAPEVREAIRLSKRIANPGCHATGFITAVYPLVRMGILPADYPLTAFSLTGYSGGGKKMIAEYESPDKPESYSAPRIYGINLKHKHLPEMQKICGLSKPPVFLPVVDDYYKGMATTIMLENALLKEKLNAAAIREKLAGWYSGEPLIRVQEGPWEGMISAGELAGKDGLILTVNGNETQTIVTALFDNLGKGASGAAVQNMNLVLGFPETAGLSV